MPVAARDSQYGTRAVGHRRQWYGRHPPQRSSEVKGWELDREVGLGVADMESPTRSGGFRMRGLSEVVAPRRSRVQRHASGNAQRAAPIAPRGTA